MTGFKLLFATASILGGCFLMSMTTNSEENNIDIDELLKAFSPSELPFEINPLAKPDPGQPLSSNEALLLAGSGNWSPNENVYYPYARLKASDNYHSLVYLAINSRNKSLEYNLVTLSKQNGKRIDSRQVASLDTELGLYTTASIDAQLDIIVDNYWQKNDKQTLISTTNHKLGDAGELFDDINGAYVHAEIPEADADIINNILLVRELKKERSSRFSRMQYTEERIKFDELAPEILELAEKSELGEVEELEVLVVGERMEPVEPIEANDLDLEKMMQLDREYRLAQLKANVPRITEIDLGEELSSSFSRMQSSDNDYYIEDLRLIISNKEIAAAKRKAKKETRLAERALKEAQKQSALAEKAKAEAKATEARFSRMPYTRKPIKIQETIVTDTNL